MKVLKVYKRSIKFLCNKCDYPVTAKNGSPCVVSGTCSPCIEGVRHNKIDWNKWAHGMKKRLGVNIKSVLERRVKRLNE